MLLHHPGTGFRQVRFRHRMGFLKQVQAVQGILPLPAGKDFPRQMLSLHPAYIIFKRRNRFAVSRLAKNRFTGKIVMTVADGTYLHDAPVFFQTDTAGIIQILMLHTAFDACPRQHRLEQGQGQAGHIFVAERHGNKKHIHSVFPFHFHSSLPSVCPL